MQVVINIPEDTFNHIRNGGSTGASLLIENAIKNGIPLPKGHGKLVDANELQKLMFSYMCNKNKTHDAKFVMSVAREMVILQSAIIEADKEDKEDKEEIPSKTEVTPGRAEQSEEIEGEIASEERGDYE